MKKALLNIVLFSFLISGCSKSEDPSPGELSEFQKETINYFKNIALGFEFGGNSEITRRWESDIKIYLGGQKNASLEEELSMIINELNGFISTGIKLSVTPDSTDSNFYLFLGSGEQYAHLFPSSSNHVKNNYGLFNINWDGNNNLFKGRMYVDIYRAQEKAQKHLLREELTQSLGLGQDSNLYLNSIFQQVWTTTTSYSEIDKEVIRLLYHPDITSGLDEVSVESILIDIFLAENLL